MLLLQLNLGGASASAELTTEDVSITGSAGMRYVAVAELLTDDAGVTATADYNANVFRGINKSTEASFSSGEAVKVSANLQGGWSIPAQVRPEQAVNWDSAEALTAANNQSWAQIPAKYTDKTDGWDAVLFKENSLLMDYSMPPAKPTATVAAWDAVLAKGWTVNSRWLKPPFKPLAKTAAWDTAKPLAKTASLPCQQAPDKFRRQWAAVWEQGNPHNWIVYQPVLPPVVPGPKVWPSALIFACIKPARVDGLTVDLVFKLTGCPWATIPTLVIPIQRSYFVSNAAVIVTLPDLIPLNVTQITISSDIDTWCWSFSASLPTSEQLNLIQPGLDGTPVEARITINGQIWEFLIEGYTHDRQFAKSGITIKGRSTSAYLAEPYAAIGESSNNMTGISARQLADLTVFPTGWTIDWQLIDWYLLAGAWSHRGTPIDRLLTLAESVGASVQTDPHLKNIGMIKRYPVLPWNFAAALPYAQLPPDIVLDLAVDWVKKPAYNAVYVSGEAVGVTAQIKRAGSAGNYNAPMAVNALITHVDAARMRGEAILADTGAQGNVILTLPIEGVAGMIPPGKLIEITEAAPWRGLTRGVNVTANWASGLTVRQVVEVERHYD